MFLRSLTAVAVLAAVSAVAPAADEPIAGRPVITGQALPPGRLLQIVRDFTRLYAGEEMAQEVDEKIKEQLGEKGFTGLDFLRPIAGYAHLTPKLDESWGVIAVPVTDEADFRDLMTRLDWETVAVEGQPGLYNLRPDGEDTGDVPLRLRFHDRYAYVGVNATDDALDAKKLLPVASLVDPAELAPIAVRLDFDRLDPAVAKQARDGAKQLAALTGNGGVAGIMMGVSTPVLGLVKSHTESVLDDGDRLTVRAIADTAAANIGYDIGLKAKPGTKLADEIAAFPPVTNRFASLIPADAVAAGIVSGRLMTEDFRNSVAGMVALTVGDPVTAAPAFAKPVVKAAVAAVVDTAKTGHLDTGVVVTGPDENDRYTAVAAVALNDATKVEAAFRKAANDAPDAVKSVVKLDVAKAGGLSVHTATIGPFLPVEAQTIFGVDATVSVAFGPKAVYAAVGPNATAELTRAIGLKAGPANILALPVNPKRFRTLLETVNPNLNALTQSVLLGADRLLPVQSVAVSGGDEFHLQAGTIAPLTMMFGVRSPLR